MIYARIYIGDYDEDTADLALLEDGAYWRLLRHYYKTEQPLPLNSDRIARICRAITLEERAAVDAVLDRFFIRGDDGWRHNRCDHEIDVSKTARANGSRGGRPSDAETGSQTGQVTGRKPEQQTGQVTGLAHPFSRLAFKPFTQNNPNPPIQPLTQSQNPSADASRRGARKAVDTRQTWEAYAQAYQQRYQVPPIRNARVNGQLASVVRSVGLEAAPAVAAFYIAHNRASYVRSNHSTNLLARDAEGLHTEWLTGRQGTETEARAADRTQATGNAFGPLIIQARKVSA